MKSDERKRKRGGEISLDRNDFLGRNGAKLMMRFPRYLCTRGRHDFAEGRGSRSEMKGARNDDRHWNRIEKHVSPIINIGAYVAHRV